MIAISSQMTRNPLGKRDKDHTHDDVPDVLVWSAEVYQEPHAQDGQRYAKIECNWFIATGAADNTACDNGEQHTVDGARSHNIAGISDTEAIYFLKEGGKVAGPAAVADK